ncbi:hypothetical protein T01_7369 [Trichinella spiralis]|uniref:Uncharacterized protein n=1 Tax=Trichinella spiralis TaxID=6334 RepID=A0A0V1BUU6_TRISP|nr:hypothetical protein T01_7369 [Trichinella spiralis]
MRPQRVPFAFRDRISEELDQLIDQGILELVQRTHDHVDCACHQMLSRCGFSVLHLWYISNSAGLNPVLLFGVMLLVPACQFEAGRYGVIVTCLIALETMKTHPQPSLPSDCLTTLSIDIQFCNLYDSPYSGTISTRRAKSGFSLETIICIPASRLSFASRVRVSGFLTPWISGAVFNRLRDV